MGDRVLAEIENDKKIDSIDESAHIDIVEDKTDSLKLMSDLSTRDDLAILHEKDDLVDIELLNSKPPKPESLTNSDDVNIDVVKSADPSPVESVEAPRSP